MRKKFAILLVGLSTVILLLPVVVSATQSKPIVDEKHSFHWDPANGRIRRLFVRDLNDLPKGALVEIEITSNHPTYKIRLFGPDPHYGQVQIAENNGLFLDCRTVKKGNHKVWIQPVGGDSKKVFKGTVHIKVFNP